MSYFGKIVVTMLTFIGITVFFPNLLFVDSFMTALLASFILSLLNLLVRPILLLLTLPLNILTLGLFTFIVNSCMLLMTSNILGKDHFSFPSFLSAIGVAILMTIVNAIVNNYHANR
ncbi:phage holin family protein [Enterococcus columbae]|uniref:Integral membrane protein n=1 Tax=Enterococcus columbae DSM 7374 = ATCC 51263 TaxID=1121865 RepID=S1NTU4_9ENTE|nr:phage holin family protein [Enterococcus columbae]EOT44136.1 hypothetical protein OMW_00190 [Enterococcus columbae DSM 7374 = ATCC 51263]EOW84294.1 hypothetical protein I568_00788 [Enterococcus columbae DSM 7374 = ATCC 51263]OJG21175.1 hypothetical protein RR47_GL001464 [Enterococcus columbae DSM 7374 = ATCC 51263]